MSYGQPSAYGQPSSYGLPFQQQQQQVVGGISTAPQQGQANAWSTTSYPSYEQVVLEHAKVLQIQQAKEQIFGVPAQKKKSYGGGSFFNKKPKPYKEPVDLRKFFCDICNITCGNAQSLETHKLGKSHKHKEALKTGKIKLDVTRPGYHCEVCNATCASKEAFAAHIAGQKHNRAVKTLQMLGKPVPEYLIVNQPKGDPMSNLPVTKKVVGVSATKFVGGVTLNTTGADDAFTMDNNKEEAFQPIGEEFLEPITGGKVTSFFCKLCDCNCTDHASRDLHVRGRRHRLAYKQKIDPSIEVEEKVLPRSVQQMFPHLANKKKKAQGSDNFSKRAPVPAYRGAKPRQQLIASHAFHQSSVLPNTNVYDSYDEQFVYARLEQLQPEPDHLEKIENLVELIERTLKKISDALVEPVADDQADARILRGVVRVGPLGENILLKFDKQADVVLLCKDVPTIKLLQKIVDEFPAAIDDEETRQKVTIETHADDSAFVVRIKDLDFKCNVTLTSVVLRKINENGDKKDSNASAATEPPKAVVKPADALPEQPCLRALAALRHAKFFQAQCCSIRNLSEVVQLLRDVCKRIDTWSVLSLYVLELLAFKSMSTCPTPLRVSDGLRRFFEMLAGGVFMGTHARLSDPCEKEDVNALKGLTPQQRENLVCSAQHGLRLMNYDQIYTILGMDRNSLNRKRPNESGDDGNEAKKPHLDASPSKPQSK